MAHIKYELLIISSFPAKLVDDIQTLDVYGDVHITIPVASLARNIRMFHLWVFFSWFNCSLTSTRCWPRQLHVLHTNKKKTKWEDTPRKVQRRNRKENVVYAKNNNIQVIQMTCWTQIRCYSGQRLWLEGFIGASLSEPHTSRTALHRCVCIWPCLRPYTINFKCMFKYFLKIECPCALAWQCWSTARVQRWQL